jgi:hypothetical protein
MPKLLLSLAMVFLFCSLSAQENPSPQDLSAQHMAHVLRRAPDQSAYKGYIISIQPAFGGTYGYDISKGGKLILSQRRNPFTHSPVGLRSKDDVFKIARWYVVQLNAGTPPKQLTNAPLPKNLSQKLNVQMR